MEPRRRLLVLTAAVVAGLAGPASARVLLTREQALKLAFPSDPAPEKRTAYLSREEAAGAAKAARAKVDDLLWTYYVGRSSDGAQGYAYFDSHVVRSADETMMIVLEADGTVRSVEVLSFLEPDDYLPNSRWLGQFKRKRLQDDLLVHRGVRNLSGASLTSEAASASIRRVLAVHAVIRAAEKVKSPSR